VDSPFRLNLEQQKKRARELLNAALDGDVHALGRFETHHPRTPPSPRLADAQLVIARELGLPSWPRLKAHIAAMRAALDGMGRGGPPDAGMTTLHVRCGYDIHPALRTAGFVGDFLEVSDPIVQGPVLPGDDWLEHRARFIHEAFDRDIGDTLAGLKGVQARLEAAARDYERVVIWTEHDSHDQLILARCLAQFDAGGRPKVLEIAGANSFPGNARFLGIGQLPPEAMILLWRGRMAASDGDLALATRVWTALRRPESTGLADILRHDDGHLPDMRRAVRRHLQELPWVRDGLSLTERLTLETVRDGQGIFGKIFGELLRTRDPLPTYGDLGYCDIVQAMLRAKEPPLDVDPDTQAADWPHWVLRLTPVGRAILAGERDWLTCGPPERWVGGVSIRAGEPAWRWDEATSTASHGTS